MEHFLHCYFDDFNKLPRNSLHDRRKRFDMVDYISTWIEGCCRGENSDSEKVACEAITSIIRYHEEMRNKNGTICMMGKYHNILYVAIKLCYNWQLKDSEIISKLLQQIHLCEQTFERIFIGAIFGTKAPYFIAGWKSDFDDQEQNLKAVVYFIHHVKCLFNVKEKLYRFIDVPIESCGRASPMKIAVQLGLPDILLTFLRFGALVYNDDESTVVENILNRLLEFDHIYPYNLVSCLQFLLRVIPTIQLNPDKYSNLIQDGLIPINRSGINPPELKHLCRCKIRYTLWENYQLPNGIGKLPIPEELQKYLDILCD